MRRWSRRWPAAAPPGCASDGRSSRSIPRRSWSTTRWRCPLSARRSRSSGISPQLCTDVLVADHGRAAALGITTWLRRPCMKAVARASGKRALIQAWHLDEPGDQILLCNLHRAESIVKRWLARQGRVTNVRHVQLSMQERDNLGLVYRPGDVCHTLTSSASNLYYISSPDGRAGFATSEAHGRESPTVAG